uniref:Uncharacterized protein n=2 Tax=Lygus hesperus TaxID=30085 RepID=A0A0K8SG40_LYGHE
MTICLVFWFLTISISVGATAIYLIKKLEMDSKNHPSEVTTDKSDFPERAEQGSEKEYMDVDVVDFLIDTFYPDAQEKSEGRAGEAAVNATSTNFTVPELDEEEEEEEEEGGRL